MKNNRKPRSVRKVILSLLLSIICVTQLTGNCFAASIEETSWNATTVSQLTLMNPAVQNTLILQKVMWILRTAPKVVDVTIELQADKTISKNQIAVSVSNSTVNIRYYGSENQKQIVVFNGLTASKVQLCFVAKDKLTDGKPTVTLDGSKLVVTYQVGNKTTPQYTIYFDTIRVWQFISSLMGGNGTWQVALKPQTPAEQKSTGGRDDSGGNDDNNKPEDPDIPNPPVDPDKPTEPEEEEPPVYEGDTPDFGEDEGNNGNNSVTGGEDLPDNEVSGVPENGPITGGNLPAQNDENQQPAVVPSAPPAGEPVTGGNLPTQNNENRQPEVRPSEDEPSGPMDGETIIGGGLPA